MLNYVGNTTGLKALNKSFCSITKVDVYVMKSVKQNKVLENALVSFRIYRGSYMSAYVWRLIVAKICILV